MAIKIRIVSDFDKKGMTEAEKALGNLSNAAGVALAAVGAALVGIGVKSVQEFAKFDAALVKSTAIMGDLTDTMKNDMSAAAREVAKVTTFSAEQAAESFFFLASAGLDAESSIKALPQVAQFAQAGMFDMALATDLLTDAQSALGLTIRNDAVKNMENMVKVSDVLVRANTLANASVEQFSTSLTTKAGAALRSLGKDVEEGVAVLAAFADQGIKGEEAGTQLSIVLRDLTTKAIKNKEEFQKLGLSVFDSNGEMRNLGDIVANLEDVLAGMSDETAKATLLQAGFSDKSLGSLLALLGTSEAIKTYEKELRSASGFTEDVAGKQLETFSSQVKLLESAFTDVAIQLGEELTPYLQELIPVLQRLLPEIGKKLADAIKQVDWGKLVTDVANFFTAIVENIDTITKVATAIGVLATGLVVYTSAAKLAAVATGIFSSTLILSPIGLVATALAALTYILIQNIGAVDKVTQSYRQLNSATAQAEYETKNLADTYRESAYVADKYGVQTDDLRNANLKLAGAAGMVSGEMTLFNNLKLSGIKSQIQGVNREIIDMYHSGVAATAVFEGVLDPRTGKGLDFKIPKLFGGKGEDGTGSGSGVSAFEQARQKVQDLISSSQKQLDDAEARYNNTAKTARATYADNILRIEKDFANRFATIVQQSQNRLRDAFRSVTTVSFADLFEVDENKSVQNLVQGLANKLAASRALLAKSGELASQGFSQTFIEQIVSAGTETGNELASAILESSPETRDNLKKLFADLEQESNSGMDKLAKEIYDKQGLATQELKNLYDQTGIELKSALFEQQQTLAKALEEAATALYDSIVEIRSDFDSEIDKMGNKLGGMLDKINAFKKALGGAEQEALAAAVEAATMPGGSLTTGASASVATAELKKAQGILIDSVEDIGGVYNYLGDRIANAERYLRGNLTEAQRASALSTLGELRSAQTGLYNTVKAGGGEAAVGTVININVKADTSQSLAMVGKSLGNTVAKYVTGGGQVIVSPV